MPEHTYRRFIMPVWVMAVTAVLKSMAIAIAIIAVKLYAERQGKGPVRIVWLLDSCIVALLILQAYVYWMLRHKLYSRFWARLHVFITAFVLLVIPLLVIFITLLFSYRLKTDDYLRVFPGINRVRLYVFWSLLVTANIFFVANCIKSWRRPDESFRDEIDSIGTN